MTNAQKIEFLIDKFAIIVASLPDEKGRANIRAMYGAVEGLRQKSSPSMIRSDDKSLEELLKALPKRIQDPVEKKLLEKYGMTRLGKASPSAESVLNKIVTRDSIQTEDEARLVSDIVDNVENERALGQRQYRKLASHLERYESPKK
jgi:hypothetical protein